MVVTIGIGIVSAPPSWSQSNRVTQVDVVGNVRINKESILAQVTTRPDMELSSADLAKDVSAIRAMGWFKDVANPRVEDVPGGGKKVTFVVTEWPVIQKIEFTGNKLIDEATLRDTISTREGQVFNTPTIDRDITKIDELYAKRGYIGRVTAGFAEGFEETGILRIPIVEGIIDSVRITGNRKTKDYVILRELSLKPGEPYSLQGLERDFRALERLDIFEAVEPKRIASDPGKVGLTWEVKEKRTGQVSVGLGYSARESLVGRAELSETNFRGRGQTLGVQFEIGSFSGGNSIEFNFVEPWLDKRHSSLSLNLYDKLVYRFSRNFESSGDFDDDERYNERHRGGVVTLGRPLNDATRVSVGLRYEDVETGDLLSVVNLPTQDGTVASTTFRGIRATRDYQTNPTAGSYTSFSVELGKADITETTRLVDGSIDTRDINSPFGKYVVELRRYWGLKPRKAASPLERQRERVPVLAARAMGGTTTGTLPFIEHFFLGGADSLRGYLEDRFWGEHMMLFSLELRVPVSSNLIGVLFVDYGDAWSPQSGLDIEDFEQHSRFEGNGSVGLGVRVRTPIGPIRLDYGYGNEGGRTHFSIGHSF
jgi:outer membrane protein insertion porin family